FDPPALRRAGDRRRRRRAGAAALLRHGAVRLVHVPAPRVPAGCGAGLRGLAARRTFAHGAGGLVAARRRGRARRRLGGAAPAVRRVEEPVLRVHLRRPHVDEAAARRIAAVDVRGHRIVQRRERAAARHSFRGMERGAVPASGGAGGARGAAGAGDAGESRMNALEQLRRFTTVVADSGDFNTMRAYAPRDATTNPTLILKAVQKPEYGALLAQTVAAHRQAPVADVCDRLLVRFGQEILSIVPGRVSTEVDARLSF